MILVGDCLEVMRTLDANSVDSIVTDPPYHLTTGKKGGCGQASLNLDTPHGRARIGTGFMGMAWDGGDVAMRPEVWAEALRVAKPGAYLVAFGGTRTYHRMACAIEDAGWELRDTLSWLYGSGFPKSHNGEWGGTALKPAWEPIVMARKPLIGTVEANWREHGTGALNIDGCRIGTDDTRQRCGATTLGVMNDDGWQPDAERIGGSACGRWPANVIHDGSDEVLACFPDAPGQQGDITGSEPSRPGKNTYGEYGPRKAFKARGKRPGGFGNVGAEKGDGIPNGPQYADTSGSAARFFYCAKASRTDRNDGLEGMRVFGAGERAGGREEGSAGLATAYAGTRTPGQNIHPTVKPTELMRWLCRLVTPPGGLVLDPFAGSGSTGRGAILEGFRFTGIELDPEYARIAEARIAAAERRRAADDARQAETEVQRDMFAQAEVAA